MKANRVGASEIVVVYNSSRAPTAEEWTRNLDVLSSSPLPRKVIVRTRGGAPNPIQRKQAIDLYKTIELPRIAVVTESTMVRGTVTLLRWFWGKSIAAYAPDHVGAIREFLSLSDHELAAATDMLERLEREVEGADGGKGVDAAAGGGRKR